MNWPSRLPAFPPSCESDEEGLLTAMGRRGGARRRRCLDDGGSDRHCLERTTADRTRVRKRSVELLLELLPGLYGPSSQRGRRARLASGFRALTGAVGCRITRVGVTARPRPGEAIARVPLGTIGSSRLEVVLRFRGRAPARTERERAALLVPHACRLLRLPEAAGPTALGATEVVERVTGTVVVLRAPLDPLAAPPTASLSPRERVVCLLVAEGLRDREIAEALGTSPRTVANQIRAASRKLAVRSRHDLACLLGLDAVRPRRAMGGER